VAYLKKLSRHSPGVTSVITAGNPSEIRTPYPSNVSLSLQQPAQWI